MHCKAPRPLVAVNDNCHMLARWWTFGVWAVVAASALFWGLRVFVQAPTAPRETVVAQVSAGARGDLTRLFGADALPVAAATEPEPAADSRFQLIGVVSPRSDRAANEGLALIAVDGKPSKAFRVGAVVEGNTVLQSVRARGATLGPKRGAGDTAANGTVLLEIAPLPVAATGTLPAIGGPGAGGVAATGGRPGPGMPGWRQPIEPGQMAAGDNAQQPETNQPPDVVQQR